eukprot:TRINITY_DN16677_c0_g1_i1.p1 TRINITY_DN16677_c0_g1~~TRINITY_DN16677_c0_g1_i1.p1  ORF type:complete len:129 (-),score=5.15 TRINITY_DN16677_c0_g1_i1:207-593(-)
MTATYSTNTAASISAGTTVPHSSSVISGPSLNTPWAGNTRTAYNESDGPAQAPINPFFHFSLLNVSPSNGGPNNAKPSTRPPPTPTHTPSNQLVPPLSANIPRPFQKTSNQKGKDQVSTKKKKNRYSD